MYYNQTNIEKWISNEYRKNNIYSAGDITIDRLSWIYDITVWKFPMDARYDIVNEQNFIIVDSRSGWAFQREQFFHELCHVLFHVGHQSNMNESFRKMLEWEADNFVLYAALPFHMIKQYDLTNDFLVHELAVDFSVTLELCRKRLEQIRNRIQHNKLLVAEQSNTYLYRGGSNG